MNVLDVLRGARELIADSELWTRNAYARDITGNRTSPLWPDAVCWCSIGALICVSDNADVTYEAELALNAVATTGDAVIDNETLGHAAILAMFDRAIAVHTQPNE